MGESVPTARYSPVCNVLRQWKPRSSLLIESTDSMILKGVDVEVIKVIQLANEVQD